MADTTLIVNGYSVLNDVQVTTKPKGGFENGGSATIRSGEAVFEADDIIVLEVSNVNADGEVTSDSYITKIIVYDSATDYMLGEVKYTYEGDQNQTAKLAADNTAVGDTYLRFGANTLTSDDPDAPDLGQMFLSAGQDLSGVADGEVITIDRFKDIDYNSNSAIDGETTEEANGLFATDNNIFAMICLARGTLIDTPDGPRYVETLRDGDMVHTLDGGPQPIRWIGSRKVGARGHLAPIRIKAGTLGNLRDLYVSPNHRMLIHGPKAELLFGETEVLVAAKHLVNDDTIRIVPRDEIEYFHFLFDDHHIVFAEACPTESLFPGAQTLNVVDDAARAEIIELFPELEADDTDARLARTELAKFEASLLRTG